MIKLNDIINNIIVKNNYKSYLEIGIDLGITFEQIRCKRKVSVDPNCEYQNVDYRVSSDEFFDKIQSSLEKYDIIFIDGLHHFGQVIRDVLNSIRWLSSNGTIIIHDCNPTTREMQLIPRLQIEWTGDVWKAILYMRSNYNYSIYTIDTDYGCGILELKEGKKYFRENMTIEEIRNLDYSYLEENRKEILNLISLNNDV